MAAPTFFANASAFRRWLQKNAGSATELVVGFHKLHSGQPSMTWPESVDEALCVGWIDGVRKRIDDDRYQIRFTPRKPGSIWSAINIGKVAQLQAQGRMTAAGLAAFAHRSEERSQVYAYEQAQTAELSAQEKQALLADPAARAYFERTPPGYRKVVLHWILRAKEAETRAARFAKLLQACAAGKRLA
jgi:uncharacterized protein YdeI (YjbR/CyaY-like superfamily)